MKKFIIAVALVIVLSVVGIGAVLAQSDTPETPNCPNCLAGQGGFAGSGWMHEYMHRALAEAVGISEEDLESRMAAGQTLYDIADDLGLNLDALSELHYQARLRAVELAYEDGALTNEQYQYFQERIELQEGFGYGGGMHGYGGGYGRGMGRGGHMFGGGQFNGDCHGYNSQPAPQN